MPFRPNVYWKTLIAVTTVAVVSVVVALEVPTESEAYALLLGALAGVVGAAFVAGWVAGSLHRLLTWLAHEENRSLRYDTSDEWQTLAERLTVFRRDTLRRLAEADAERERLRAVVMAMADGMLVVGADGHIRFANPAALSMLGVTPEQALGRTVIECVMSADLDEAVHAALDGDVPRAADLDILYPQTRRVRAIVRASGEGRDRTAVAVLRDQTETHRIDEVRRDFVANVSHELRTPVTGIQTLSESLLDGALEDPRAARHFLEHILASSRRLVALVDDLLGLARAETKAPGERSAVPLAPIARTVVAGLDPLISQKRLDVGVDVPDDLAVWGDPESVRQVLSNLVDNAVKYTPDGGSVDVTAAPDGTMARVQVRDTGIGIPPEHQGRVFERFYRVDRARSRQVGGTGLGLSIVKHLVEGMGGQVSLESEPGRGSTFTATLPLPPDRDSQG